ncbi:MAG: hypothetical protein K6U80_08785 [Firmicutes bacterium]|nr:hypothetical protein [Bacillota bacterium]
MKQRRLLIFGILTFLIFSLAAFPVLAKISDEEKNRNIDLIIEKSGIRAQLAGLPEMVKQQALGAAGANNLRLAEILKENFALDDLLAEVKLVFLREFNESHTKSIVKFLESDLAARMVRYESESMGPGFADKRNDFDPGRYSDKRRQIVTKFFEAVKAQNFYYVLQSSIMESMLQAINKLLPEEAQISGAQIAKIKQQIKEQVFSAQAKEVMLADYFLIYDRATDAEMEEYTKFNASRAGRWMNQCIEKGIVNGMQKYAEKIVVAVVGFAQSIRDDAEAAEEEELENSAENVQNSF